MTTSSLVLTISGAAGFVVVALGFPDWQIAVEPAQVLAGIVAYPADNPVRVCYLKIWTIVHQLGAVLLLAGMSEVRLSVLITGVQGMVTFQAIAMVVYALSRDATLALVSVVVVVACGAATSGVAYPIFLLGTSHTWGALGLSTIVLAAALIGCGQDRAGLFVTGLAPAVHASLGLWFVLVVGFCLALDPARSRRLLRDHWRALAAGVGLSAASLALYLFHARGIPDVPPDITAKYVAAFTTLWDEHRRPVWFDGAGVRLNVAAIAVSAVWLAALRRLPQITDGAAGAPAGDTLFLLRFFAAAGALSIGFVLLSQVPPGRLPVALVTLMPTRFANVNAMAYPAALLGLAGLAAASHGRAWTPWLVVALAALLLAGRRSMVWEWLAARGLAAGPPRIDSMAIVAAATLALIAAAVFLAWRRAAGPDLPRSSPLAVRAALVGLAAIVVWTGTGPVRKAGRELTVFRDRSNDLVFNTASRGPGLLLTGGDLMLVQLRSRRPVLIYSGALDLLAYAHAAAPALDQILRDVYAIDLFSPPPGTPRVAVVPPAYNRRVWHGYSPERWREIRDRYGVSHVIVPTDWELALPIVARSGPHLLYEIR